MSSFYAWLSDLVNRLILDCDKSGETVSNYINILGIIQLLEGKRIKKILPKTGGTHQATINFSKKYFQA